MNGANDTALSRATDGIASAPIFSEAAHAAYRLIDSPSCSIKALTNAIHRDPGLTISILAIANSALYAPPKPIDRLSEAIVLLGLRECQHLILAACTTRFVNQLYFADEEVRQGLIFHSCATAVACREIGRRGQWCFEGEEYCAGLIHDIGRLMLASVEPEKFNSGGFLHFDEEDDPRNAERTVFGTDHCELGRELCKSNLLPATLVESVAYHHNLERAREAASLVRVVAYADEFANYLSAEKPVEEYQPLNPALRSDFENDAKRRLGFELDDMPGILESIRADAFSAVGVFTEQA